MAFSFRFPADIIDPVYWKFFLCLMYHRSEAYIHHLRQFHSSMFCWNLLLTIESPNNLHFTLWIALEMVVVTSLFFSQYLMCIEAIDLINWKSFFCSFCGISIRNDMRLTLANIWHFADFFITNMAICNCNAIANAAFLQWTRIHLFYESLQHYKSIINHLTMKEEESATQQLLHS